MHIDAADPALGCAVTYPLGVVGVILAVIVLRKMFPRRTAETVVAEDKSKHTFIAGFEVRNPGIFGKNVKSSSPCGTSICYFTLMARWESDDPHFRYGIARRRPFAGDYHRG